MWITIALIWALVMFFLMPYWHLVSEQNLSNEAYKIKPEVYAEKVETWAAKYTVREEGDTGIPVVHPLAGGDVYMLGRLSNLKKGNHTASICRLLIGSMAGFFCQKTSIFLCILATRWFHCQTDQFLGVWRYLQRILRDRSPHYGWQDLSGW